MPKIVPYSIYNVVDKRENTCILFAISNLFNYNITKAMIDEEAFLNAGNFIENTVLREIGIGVYTESICRDTSVSVENGDIVQDDSFINKEKVVAILYNEDIREYDGAYFLGVIIRKDNESKEITQDTFVMHRILVVIYNGTCYLVDSNMMYIVECNKETLSDTIRANYFGVCDISVICHSGSYKRINASPKEFGHIINGKDLDVILN